MRPIHETALDAPGEHEHPALALVNSRRNGPAGPVDELASTADLRAWLADHQLGSLPRCDGSALRSVLALRDAIRKLLLAGIEGRTPDPSAVEAVNQAAAAMTIRQQLDWSPADGPLPRREFLGPSGIARARALLAADAIDLLAGPDRADLQACGAPGCVRLMLRDHPRRRWCSTRCGDRVRASRYYHRHHSASPGTTEPS